MNGVSLKVDSEGFWVASEVPLQVVSSSVGERLEETGNILSAGMPADPEQREYTLRRPRAFIRERALALETWPETGFSRVVSYTWGIKK